MDRITINFGRASVKDELHSCEYGSYEDHIHSDDCSRCDGFGDIHGSDCGRCGGAGWTVKREEPYSTGRLHAVELIERDESKTRVHLDTEEEVSEFFRSACTGTFGLYHLKVLQRIYKQLEPYVSAAELKRIPYSSLGYWGRYYDRT